MAKEWNKKGSHNEDVFLEFIKNYDFKYFVAFQTDRFLSGYKRDDSLNRVIIENLLEIRLFSDKEELLARRTMIGKNNLFQWRIASEEGMNNKEFITSYQTLDIDSAYTQEGKYGNLKLMTTGGGEYELPIDGTKKSIKVISYVSYSEKDGMAYIYDNRLVDFVDGGEV